MEAVFPVYQQGECRDMDWTKIGSLVGLLGFIFTVLTLLITLVWRSATGFTELKDEMKAFRKELEANTDATRRYGEELTDHKREFSQFKATTERMSETMNGEMLNIKGQIQATNETMIAHNEQFDARLAVLEADRKEAQQ